MTVTKALKKLYLTITGSASTKSSAAKILSDLADNWTPGAAFPAVTSADNGKVMKVVSGAWGAGADSGSVLPSYSAADAGKILTVQNDGTLAWVTPEEPDATE